VICNSANFWDDGYPSGGNYWDDHVGTDLYSGPYQNIPGSDGIGDTPRVIYTGVTVTDHYPLMEPRPPTVHDIAVISVSPSKTVVGQGYDAKFNVTVENQGDFTETFNLDAYANATLIGTQLASNLPVGEMRMYTFVWNTAGLAYGNYTISATAAQVTGELDTADNTFVDGVVKVTIAGDVDGDFDVDIMDVVSITGRYMRPVPLWWPGPPALPNDNNCDINGDGVISILDVVICTSHYGQKWP